MNIVDFYARANVLTFLVGAARDKAEQVINAILAAEAYRTRLAAEQGLGWTDAQEEEYWQQEAWFRRMSEQFNREEAERDRLDAQADAFYAEQNEYYTALFEAEDAERAADLEAKEWDEVADRLERGSYPRHFRITEHAVIRHRRSVRFRHKPKAKRGVFRRPRPVGRPRLTDEPETSAGRNQLRIAM